MIATPLCLYYTSICKNKKGVLKMVKKWTTKDFAVGVYNIHPDPSVNFQMNRFYNWTNDQTMLDEMRQASHSIHSYDDLIKSFLRLGKNALDKDEKQKAAYYMRGAEFFIPESDPRKQELRKQFIDLINAYYGVTNDQHHLISYDGGFLSAYRFTPEKSKGTIVFCNGFDGYIEEANLMIMVFRDAGYDVISFDGPGQGTSLEEHHMPMTHEWEKPVKTLLDYFKLTDITLIGGSLGGYLALRAAAYEKRIKRVIAFDVLADFFEVMMRQVPPVIQDDLKEMIVRGTEQEKADAKLRQLMKESLMLEWGLTQGMHVTGSDSPYEFIHKTILYNTAVFSPLITQDILLLAGQDDHYVPVKQLTDQIATLTNVRSLTARMFTSEESAGSHCQLGNLGLAAGVMLNWIEQIS